LHGRRSGLPCGVAVRGAALRCLLCFCLLHGVKRLPCVCILGKTKRLPPELRVDYVDLPTASLPHHQGISPSLVSGSHPTTFSATSCLISVNVSGLLRYGNRRFA